MLTKLLGSKQEERRKHKRAKDKPFKVLFKRSPEDPWIEGKSIDISAGGFGALLDVEEEPQADSSWIVTLGLDDQHSVCVRAKIQSVTPGTLQGKKVFKLGCRFSGIAADDWDTVVRFATNRPLDDAPSAAVVQAKENAMKAEDVGRIMPKHVLQQVLQQIVAKRRLAPLNGKEPLVKYYYAGRIMRGETTVHNMRIASRVVVDGESRDYNSRVTLAVSPDGNYRLDVS